MSADRNLTSAQRDYLLAVIPEELTSAELGVRFGTSTDAARKVMNRLESRSLVKGDGTGARRVWGATAPGRALAGEEETETPVRPYRVFEETGLDRVVGAVIEDSGVQVNEAQRGWLNELMGVLAKVPGVRLVHECEARNTEHACRQAGKAYDDELAVEVVQMVAVPANNWKSKPVRIKTRREVSVG